MTELNEEKLMAYADGELDPQTAAEVEIALANDPKARKRVRLYQQAAELSQQAFGEPMHGAAVPRRLLQAAGAAPEASSNVMEFSKRSARGSGWSIRRLAMPLAASLALAIGGAVGYQMHPSLQSAQTVGALAALSGQIDPTSKLHHLLENTASGETIDWTEQSDGIEGRAIAQLTFEDAGGRYCRQYQLSLVGPETQQATTSVACRSKGGLWRSEITVRSPMQGDESGGGVYVAASGEGDAVLDLFLDRVMVGPAYDSSTESRVLKAKWR